MKSKTILQSLLERMSLLQRRNKACLLAQPLSCVTVMM